jgi:hypothetical protein
MAIQPNTGLETHPSGTTNPNGIITGNWEQIERLFDPETSWTDDYANTVRDAILKDGTEALTDGAAVEIDMAKQPIKTLAITQNTTFTIANPKKGARVLLEMTATGGPFTLTWPGTVLFYDTATSIAANKGALVELVCKDSTTPAFFATFKAQP